jgi:Fe/S biogenesis protein NfuA
MIKITDLAQQKIRDAIQNNSDPVIGIRILAQARSPFQVSYGLAFVTEKGASEKDHVTPFEGFNIYVEDSVQHHVEGVTLDFQDGLHGSGFKFLNIPRVPKEYAGTIAEKVVRVIDEEINPAIASHGGYVSLIDVKGTDVIIQMGGGCQGCGMANVTLRDGIEVALKNAVPEISGIYDVTDHANGKNPYYKS